jgi:hypothetical protein
MATGKNLNNKVIPLVSDQVFHYAFEYNLPEHIQQLVSYVIKIQREYFITH